MINAYVVGITNHYEGEDIEVRYSIYDEQELLSKRSFFKEIGRASCRERV